jgi:hypothetical protein
MFARTRYDFRGLGCIEAEIVLRSFFIQFRSIAQTEGASSAVRETSGGIQVISVGPEIEVEN